MVFWLPWSAALYDHPLTQVSMGRDPHRRRWGNWTAGFLLASVAYAWLVYALSPEQVNWFGFAIIACMSSFSAYEVWAFTHGRGTSIGSFVHEAHPAKTGWRVFGLSLDLLTWVFCMWVFVRGV
jgi:hypothetical protein